MIVDSQPLIWPRLRWKMAKLAAQWVECPGVPWERELEEAAEDQASKRHAKKARGKDVD